MADDPGRRVELSRIGKGRLEATNARGGTITVGTGEGGEFTPVELLLTAIAACSGIDIDFITGKRAEPERFAITVSGDKMRDAGGNRITNLSVDFDVAFADTEEGAAAEAVLVPAAARSHDRLCTVSRTVELPSPIEVFVRGEPVPVQHPH